ncbi:hypothetical protein [uncultured Sphaerochaeta sp.]|nr:hypothetical protein [uncultured Sphaerochaeta sp.]
MTSSFLLENTEVGEVVLSGSGVPLLEFGKIKPYYDLTDYSILPK